MTRTCITHILERMNALERLKLKYNDRASVALREGRKEHCITWEHRMELVEREVKGIQFALHSLGFHANCTRDGNWVIPADDIRRAI